MASDPLDVYLAALERKGHSPALVAFAREMQGLCEQYQCDMAKRTRRALAKLTESFEDTATVSPPPKPHQSQEQP